MSDSRDPRDLRDPRDHHDSHMDCNLAAALFQAGINNCIHSLAADRHKHNRFVTPCVVASFYSPVFGIVTDVWRAGLNFSRSGPILLSRALYDIGRRMAGNRLSPNHPASLATNATNATNATLTPLAITIMAHPMVADQSLVSGGDPLSLIVMRGIVRDASHAFGVLFRVYRHSEHGGLAYHARELKALRATDVPSDPRAHSDLLTFFLGYARAMHECQLCASYN